MNNPDTALIRLLSMAERETAGYVHTGSEIAAQPELWRRTGDLIASASSRIGAFLGPAPRVVFSGAGSSHYVGLSIAPALRRVFPWAAAVPSTEIVMDPESAFPREDFVLVSFARSGDSPEGNAVIELAEKLRPARVRHLVVTCNPEGGLARIVGGLGKRGLVVVLPEGTNDRSLAMTSSFSSMTLAGLLLGGASRGEPERCRAIADSLAAAGERVLSAFPDIAANLAGEGFRRAFFVASPPYFGAALEAHLKVQELTAGAVVAKAEDTLGLRHGFMAAIDAETLIVLYVSSDPYRRSYEIDLAKELRRKGLGKKTVLVCDKADGLSGLGDLVFQTGSGPALDDYVRAPVAVLPGQLLGFFASLALGLKPDSPSPAGVINRVVSGVVIHPYPASEGSR